MALDANSHANTVTGIDNAGTFTRTDEDVVALRGQALEVHARRLVGAVLRPHHAVEGELHVVGLSLQNGADVLQLRIGQAKGAV